MLISPSAQTPLPKDTEKALKDAYNSVTLAEAEHSRLVEMQVALESEIVEIVKRKKYEEELLGTVLSELGYSEDKLNSNKLLIASQEEKIASQLVQISESDERLLVKEKDAQNREIELKQWSEELTKLQDDIDRRELKVSSREMIMLDKETKLKEFINNL